MPVLCLQGGPLADLLESLDLTSIRPLGSDAYDGDDDDDDNTGDQWAVLTGVFEGSSRQWKVVAQKAMCSADMLLTRPLLLGDVEVVLSGKGAAECTCPHCTGSVRSYSQVVFGKHSYDLKPSRVASRMAQALNDCRVAVANKCLLKREASGWKLYIGDGAAAQARDLLAAAELSRQQQFAADNPDIDKVMFTFAKLSNSNNHHVKVWSESLFEAHAGAASRWADGGTCVYVMRAYLCGAEVVLRVLRGSKDHVMLFVDGVPEDVLKGSIYINSMSRKTVDGSPVVPVQQWRFDPWALVPTTVERMAVAVVDGYIDLLPVAAGQCKLLSGHWLPCIDGVWRWSHA